MRYLVIILLLFCYKCKAQDTITNVQMAGIKFSQAQTCQLFSLGMGALGYYAVINDDPGFAKFAFVASGALQLASITLYYKGCQYLISPTSLIIRF